MKNASPKICFESKPKVIIDLPPILEAYCRYVFETPPKQEVIVANRKSIIGKAINGLIEKTNEKEGMLNFVNPVIFTIPETKLNWYSNSTNYIYMQAEENEAFVDRLETLYSGWVENLFRTGYDLNLDQCSIIECVLDLLNVRMNVASFDQVKKYDYRNRRKVIHSRAKALLKLRESAY